MDTLRPHGHTFGQDFLDNMDADVERAFNKYTALLREQQAGLAAAQIADADAQAVPEAVPGDAARDTLLAGCRASPPAGDGEPQARRELGLHAEPGEQHGELAFNRQPAAAQTRRVPAAGSVIEAPIVVAPEPRSVASGAEVRAARRDSGNSTITGDSSNDESDDDAASPVIRHPILGEITLRQLHRRSEAPHRALHIVSANQAPAPEAPVDVETAHLSGRAYLEFFW